MLFLALAFAVFWGTVFPLISELITGTKITVGRAYFTKVTGPLFFALVLLMGIAPLFACRNQTARKLGRAILVPFISSLGITAIWGYIHRMHPISIFGLWLVSFVLVAILVEFWKGVHARMSSRGENILTALVKMVRRNHRRYGGYIINLGVVMIALGVIGDSFFKQETQDTVSLGEILTIGEYSLRFEGLHAYPGSDGRDFVEASTFLYNNGEFIRELNPSRDYFIVQEQPVTLPYRGCTPRLELMSTRCCSDGKPAMFKLPHSGYM